MKKNLLCMALALVMAIGMLAGCGGNDGDVSSADNGSTRVWKFSHTRAEGTDNDIMANKFADSLTGAIDGLKIEMYPNNQLGDYTVVQEAVGLGEVQLMLGSMSNGVDPTLSVQIAPYLVNTWDEAYDWYNSTDGLMYQYVAERLEMQNIHLLAVMPKYFGAIMTTTPASNIDNPTANKSVKIRVPQMKSFEQFASAVGFQTTPLPTSDTFTALQTGVVNGSCGGGAEQYYSDFGELAKHVYCLRTHMENHWLTVDKACSLLLAVWLHGTAFLRKNRKQSRSLRRNGKKKRLRLQERMKRNIPACLKNRGLRYICRMTA